MGCDADGVTGPAKARRSAMRKGSHVVRALTKPMVACATFCAARVFRYERPLRSRLGGLAVDSPSVRSAFPSARRHRGWSFVVTLVLAAGGAAGGCSGRSFSGDILPAGGGPTEGGTIPVVDAAPGPSVAPPDATGEQARDAATEADVRDAGTGDAACGPEDIRCVPCPPGWKGPACAPSFLMCDCTPPGSPRRERLNH
jgi:hypothetical protein